MYKAIPTTVLVEGDDTDGAVSDVFRRHITASHLMSTKQQAPISQTRQPLCYAFSISGFVNIVLGIVAIVPELADQYHSPNLEKCNPDFDRWLLVFGIVAICCPALHTVCSWYYSTENIVGDDHEGSRPLHQWVVIFGGPCMFIINWIFNLTWALFGFHVFTQHHLFDEKLSPHCQRAHARGWMIVLVILGGAVIILCGTLGFCAIFVNVLLKNRYREGQV